MLFFSISDQLKSLEFTTYNPQTSLFKKNPIPKNCQKYICSFPVRFGQRRDPISQTKNNQLSVKNMKNNNDISNIIKQQIKERKSQIRESKKKKIFLQKSSSLKISKQKYNQKFQPVQQQKKIRIGFPPKKIYQTLYHDSTNHLKDQIYKRVINRNKQLPNLSFSQNKALVIPQQKSIGTNQKYRTNSNYSKETIQQNTEKENLVNQKQKLVSNQKKNANQRSSYKTISFNIEDSGGKALEQSQIRKSTLAEPKVSKLKHSKSRSIKGENQQMKKQHEVKIMTLVIVLTVFIMIFYELMIK